MVKVATLDYSTLRVRDLSAVASKRLRITGTFAWVPDSEREAFGGTEYLLYREPKNRHDKLAIAIYSRQRKVGYVPAATASVLAPLLDRFDDCDGFVVSGTSTLGSSSRLWIDVPRVPELRALVKQVVGNDVG
jgi:hypothetical protein